MGPKQDHNSLEKILNAVAQYSAPKSQYGAI